MKRILIAIIQGFAVVIGAGCLILSAFLLGYTVTDYFRAKADIATTEAECTLPEDYYTCKSTLEDTDRALIYCKMDLEDCMKGAVEKEEN